MDKIKNDVIEVLNELGNETEDIWEFDFYFTESF